MANNNQQLKLLTWNANDIKNKIFELYDLINNNIQIACINETFLKSNINLHSHPNYHCYRFDTEDRLQYSLIGTSTTLYSPQQILNC